MKRCTLIYNPTSGKKQFKKRIDYVVRKFENAGYVVTIKETTKPKDAISLAKEAAEEMVDLLVVSGGDGTFHECLNGISIANYKPTIGYIPSGTACDLASTLKIPKNIDKAIDIILNGEIVKMDYGETNQRDFIYVAAIGTYVDISYVTDSKLKKKLGYLAYIVTGIKEFFTIPIIKAKIEYDDGYMKGHYSMILIVNSKKVAGFNIVNKPILDDGKLDVVIYRYIPFFNNLIYFISFLFSPKVLPGVTKIRTSKLNIYTDHPHRWNLDGEEAESGDLLITTQKQQIPIIINTKIKTKLFKEQ